ncbi:MAG TPA: DUF4007 family protein [Pyrinomonadaceae bacterium]|nr:DUF4007 family protein [Pyrinomonadaceae bacterium]
MSLTFHESFQLERENLAKVLKLFNNDPSITNVQIAEACGIGIGADARKGKVQPTIEYAKHSGLLIETVENHTRRLSLTQFGKIAFQHDAWLRKPTTQWAMHYQISKLGSEAEAWTFLVHEFLPSNVEFERSMLEEALQNKFGDRAKLRSINPGVLLNCYLDGGGLERIRLIREKARHNFMRTQTYIPNHYITAYILAELWEAKHPERSMVGEDALLEPGHLATTMGFGEKELEGALRQMSALGAIAWMREAPPYQVARRWQDKLDLLDKAFIEET